MDAKDALGAAGLVAAYLLVVVGTVANAVVVYLGRSRARILAGQDGPRAPLVAAYASERHAILRSGSLVRDLGLAAAVTDAIWIAGRHAGYTGWHVLWTAVAAFAFGSVLRSTLQWLVGRRAQALALWLAPAVHGLRLVVMPAALLIELPGRLLDRVLPAPEREEAEQDTELLALVEMEEGEGHFEPEERAMIRGVIGLEDTTASEIMVPRVDVLAIPVETSFEEAARVAVEGGFSRIPVYEGSVDSVVGVLYAKDLLAAMTRGERPASLRDIARPALFVPETKRVDDLLRELRDHRIHMAIVVDEYGGTAGLVTIEDLIEEIVGEIEDEYDRRQEPTVERLPDGEALVDARLSVDDLEELLGVLVERGDYDTVGGFLYQHLGKIPQVGDEVAADGYVFQVVSVTGRRIRKVQVRRVEHEAGPPGGNGRSNGNGRANGGP